MLNGKIPQETAAVFPEFDVGYLDQILHYRLESLAPETGRAHNREADGLSDTQNKLLPRCLVTRSGTETDNVFERQRRIPRRSRNARHPVVSCPSSERSWRRTDGHRKRRHNLAR